ncbi:MAG: DegV family protein [Clostridia bacterium]|nr:DegV family protein [Clostridia bacterium]MDD4571151.1 DegV family protein [Clostridia bacterium]
MTSEHIKDYVIFTDSTSDLPVNIIQENNIQVIPMCFEIGEKKYMHYPDEREMNSHEFYDKLRVGSKSVTTLISIATYMAEFEPFIKAGKDIIYIAFSSALSGTYNSSLIAAEELMHKYPENRIICVDSRCASVGEGLLVYTAALEKAEGLKIDELYEWLLEQRFHLCHWFTVDDLEHLRRGGRMTLMTAAIGTALNIKPVLHVDDEGRLIPVSKVRGRLKSLHALVTHMEETCIKPEEQIIFIGHGDSLKDAEIVADMVREKFAVKDVIINSISPIIGTHSGPGTIALFFFGTKK